MSVIHYRKDSLKHSLGNLCAVEAGHRMALVRSINPSVCQAAAATDT